MFLRSFSELACRSLSLLLSTLPFLFSSSPPLPFAHLLPSWADVALFFLSSSSNTVEKRLFKYKKKEIGGGELSWSQLYTTFIGELEVLGRNTKQSVMVFFHFHPQPPLYCIVALLLATSYHKSKRKEGTQRDEHWLLAKLSWERNERERERHEYELAPILFTIQK